eukprot:g9333.t1
MLFLEWFRLDSVRPDNFLWGGPGNKTLKLCDYGLAVMMPPKGKLHGVFGTAPYMAPEMLRNEGYDFLADVWSIGSVAYLLVTMFGFGPHEACQDNPPLKFPSPSDAQGVVSGSLTGALAFTKMLLKRTAKERPTAEEALRHEFVADKTAVSDKVEKVNEDEAEPMLRRNAHQAKKLTQQLRRKRDSTVQNGIDDLLQKLITKFGGDISDINGSNIFFSEGDENLEINNEEEKLLLQILS